MKAKLPQKLLRGCYRKKPRKLFESLSCWNCGIALSEQVAAGYKKSSTTGLCRKCFYQARWICPSCGIVLSHANAMKHNHTHIMGNSQAVQFIKTATFTESGMRKLVEKNIRGSDSLGYVVCRMIGGKSKVYGPVRTIEEARNIREELDVLYGFRFRGGDEIIKEIRADKERLIPKP